MRSNVGNIATNAIQTMAISGTTAAGMKVANEARKLNRETSPYTYMTEEERVAVGKSRADALREKLNEDNQSVEEQFQELEKSIPVSRLNTEEGKEISKRISNDINYIDEFMKIAGKGSTVTEFKSKKEGERKFFITQHTEGGNK